MKTKAAYVLISQETDYYYERLRLSIYTLLAHNPDMEVVILTDGETQVRLKNPEFPENVNVFVVMIPDSLEQMQKSRYLKTRMCHWIKGPFVYLDTDTLICGKLDAFDSLNADIGMIANGNHPHPPYGTDLIFF